MVTKKERLKFNKELRLAEARILEKIKQRMHDLSQDEKLKAKTDNDLHKKFKI